MSRVKIGEVITIDNEHKLESVLTGDIVVVKDGDKGYVDSSGNIHYTKGEARGKIAPYIEIDKLSGYDTENIARMILSRLKWQFGLDEFMEGYEVEDEHIIEEVEDVLMDILL